eukprot:NODE_659_length_4968_cov_0.490655.p5 type:complete len:114 gc:universal NODE_659_length_4968_cov_0.490655:2872-2531(-)
MTSNRRSIIEKAKESCIWLSKSAFFSFIVGAGIGSVAKIFLNCLVLMVPPKYDNISLFANHLCLKLFLPAISIECDCRANKLCGFDDIRTTGVCCKYFCTNLGISVSPFLNNF